MRDIDIIGLSASPLSKDYSVDFRKPEITSENIDKVSLSQIRQYYMAHQNLYSRKAVICLAKEYYKGKLVGLRVASLLRVGDSISIANCERIEYMKCVVKAINGSILNVRVVDNGPLRRAFITDKTKLFPWTDIFAPLKFNLSDKKYISVDYLDYTEEKYMGALLHRYEAVYNLGNLSSYIKPRVLKDLPVESVRDFGHKAGYFELKHYKQLLLELNQGGLSFYKK